MYFGAKTFSFIIATLLCTYSIAKISDILNLNRKLSVVMMVFSVVCLGFLYQYLYFLKINELPANGEAYKIKEAFFDYSFRSDASADVKHRLLFEKNKNDDTKHSMSYIFYEINDINSLEVTLNDNVMKLSEMRTPNTYELKSNTNKNILTVYYFPHNKSETMNLTVAYSVKNAVLKQNGSFVYYNTFFPERTDFSFNTNVKGTVTFRSPEGSIADCAANSEDFWVNSDNSKKDSLIISFKNKIPYEKYLFSNLSNWIHLYDPASYAKTYFKDFSLITRLDFLPTAFQGTSNLIINELNNSVYSVSELMEQNEESNSKFSTFRFLLGVFVTSWEHGNCLFLVIAFPIIFSYYKKAA